MKLFDAFLLIALSAIWGASFLFLRIAAPEFGPVPLILIRVSIAALLLAPLLIRSTSWQLWRTHAFHLFIQGLLNSALPFSLLAFATLRLEAGFTSLLNATTPIFTAVIGTCWLRIPLTSWQIAGLALGVAGIGILAGDQLHFQPGGTGWAVLAVLGATFSYGVAGQYAKRYLSQMTPMAVSAGSLSFSALLLIPVALPYWPTSMPGNAALWCALALAIPCTALAFVMFFLILSRNGATTASSVTFVIPVFGILWGALFLAEEVTVRMKIGMMVALAGTALTIGIIPLRKRLERAS